MRGRRIFGDVVAYGRPWRTGANAPTKIKFGEEVEIGEYRLKPGEYMMYAIPNRERWEIVFNTGAGKWSANGFPREDDVARVTVRSSAMATECQTFTIQVSDIAYNTCKLELLWDRTKIVIPIAAMNTSAIEASIDKSVNSAPTIPYFQAALYYFESNKKIDLAHTYVNRALEQEPKAFYIWYLKARIEKKLGNKEDAVIAAKKSMELARGNANEYEYIHNNQKLIDELNRQMRPRQVD
jgi:tetratricopeptide (TPR) repeat protein